MRKTPPDVALPVLQPALDRRGFLKTLGCAAGCAALASLAKGCTVVELYGGAGSDVTFDLAVAPYDALRTVGGAVPVDTGARKLLLIRVTETEMVALDRICTHVGCDMTPGVSGAWDTASRSLVCVCHGSVFDENGTVLTGPASRDLDTFPVEFDAAAGTGVIRVAGDEPQPGDPLRLDETDGEVTLALDTPGAEPLAAVNGMVPVDVGDAKLLMIRTADDTVVTLDRLCTHEACDLAPNRAGVFVNGRLGCMCHFSEFAPDGSVLTGPAERPLTAYATTFDAAAGEVTVRLR
jgi:Rieske Fe-S protein